MDRLLPPKKNFLPLRWYLLMAWRDSRKNRGRLVLFISSIVLGIAALVSTLSFGHNLREGIDDQAKELLGADLVINAGRPLKPADLSLALDQKSVECNFGSMVVFCRSGESRLVDVRALEGGFPYYGQLGTTPVAAGKKFQRGRLALVDKTLMLQYGAKVGDSIRIGKLNFAIAGSLDKAPGRNEVSLTVAPPVYIPFRFLEKTEVLRPGSRVAYHYYFHSATRDPSDLAEAVAESGRKLEGEGLDFETVESRKRRMSRAFDDLTEFMVLISFIALLLGCVGVASSVNVYMREKVDDVAVLRCLGLKARQAFFIYLIQVAGIGLAGSIAGSFAGVLLQRLLPLALKDILPIDASFRLSWSAIGEGVVVGVIVSLLFALLPLLSIRKVSPLRTLRLSVEGGAGARDPLRWLVYSGVLLFVLGFAYLRMGSLRKAEVFTGCLLGTFLLLAGVARLLIFVVRRWLPSRWNYLWRQGFANLFRPNNQTLVLMVTIGLGTTFIGTLYFVQEFLMDRVMQVAGGVDGNMILFDVQPDQEKGVVQLAGQFRLPMEAIPVVAMRVLELRGKDLKAVDQYDSAVKVTGDVQGETGVRRERLDRGGRGGVGRGRGGMEGNDTTGRDTGWISRRLFEQELRVTYRDTLIPAEKLVAGRLGDSIRKPGDNIPVSVDEDYARRMGIRLGDVMVFNIQGVRLSAVVGSLRRVEWRRMQPSFFIVFPKGVLEEAPQMYVLITKVSTPEESAKFQQAVVSRWPTVSVIDLRLVLSVLDDVLGKIGFVIRFMAGFSILTGVVVLVASVLISKLQRIRESVLLRTLGATRRQVRVILLLEYFFLGALAAMTGLVLAIGFGEALAEWTFETTMTVRWTTVAGLFGFVCGLTMAIGLYNSRGVLNKPPLEVLRREE
jgi:putative ABC transport system permease protein